jgi:hypothetical protein
VPLDASEERTFLLCQNQFHIINAQRRLADWHFERAQTWVDLLAAHEKWLLDFNYQHHFAHEQPLSRYWVEWQPDEKHLRYAAI